MRILFAFSVCFVLLSAVGQNFAAENREPVVTVMVCEERDEAIYLAPKNVPALITELGKENNWEVVILTSEKFADFPSVEVLDRTDVLVLFVRRIGLPAEKMQRVKKYVNESGKGLVALRTACHGFSTRGDMPEGCEDWAEFDKDVIGGNYNNHANNGIGSEIWNVKELEQSPILKDVRPSLWRSSGSVYFTTPLADDTTVYQYAATSQHRMPLTWTRMHGNTRVAYTALGHKDDFEVPAFKTLIRNLVHWAAETDKP